MDVIDYIMFLFGLLIQVGGVFAAKEPYFLKERENNLKSTWSKNGKWKISNSKSIRAIIQHQIICHLRDFYMELNIVRFFFGMIIIIFAIISIIYYIINYQSNTKIEITSESIIFFIIFFLSYSIFIGFLSLFCFLLSFLMSKNPNIE